MSDPLLSVTLPSPPSANRLWRHIGFNKVLRSREYRAWTEAATVIIRAEISGALDGPYQMNVEVGRPDRRRRDLDNLIKPLGDSLVAAGAVTDDANCQRIEAAWSSQIVGVRVTLVTATFIEPIERSARAKARAR